MSNNLVLNGLAPALFVSALSTLLVACESGGSGVSSNNAMPTTTDVFSDFEQSGSDEPLDFSSIATTDTSSNTQPADSSTSHNADSEDIISEGDLTGDLASQGPGLENPVSEEQLIGDTASHATGSEEFVSEGHLIGDAASQGPESEELISEEHLIGDAASQGPEPGELISEEHLIGDAASQGPRVEESIEEEPVSEGHLIGDSASQGPPPGQQVTVSLSADQQVPSLDLPNSSGVANFWLESSTGAIAGAVTVSGLSSTARMAHLNVASENSNGPVLMALSRVEHEGENENEKIVVFSVPTGSALDAVAIDHYLNGELYINVRTDAYPAGEIRGQIVPLDIVGRTRFEVTVSNTSDSSTLSIPSYGSNTSVTLSPGIFVVHANDEDPIIAAGVAADEAVEAFAEEGNPTLLQQTVPGAGIFNTPVGSTLPSLLESAQEYSFKVTAEPGNRLSLATSLMQSNDWFYTSNNGEQQGIALFGADGRPVSGDVSSQMVLWEAGTEEDEEAGAGAGQPLNFSETGQTGVDSVDGLVNSLMTNGKLDSVSSILNGDVVKVTIRPIP